MCIVMYAFTPPRRPPRRSVRTDTWSKEASGGRNGEGEKAGMRRRSCIPDAPQPRRGARSDEVQCGDGEGDEVGIRQGRMR